MMVILRIQVVENYLIEGVDEMILSVKNVLENICERINYYSILGERFFPSGTRLVGHIPHTGDLGHLHHLFSGLTELEFHKLEMKFMLPSVEDLKLFYLSFNGISLFDGALEIYGLRGLERTSMDKSWEPYSVFIPNLSERHKDALPQHFFFGAFQRQVSFNSDIYIDLNTQKYYECARGDSVKPFMSWDSLGEMLLYYFNLLEPCFDEKGHKIANWRKPPIL
jgi:hypothetical protein